MSDNQLVLLKKLSNTTWQNKEPITGKMSDDAVDDNT